MHGGSELIMDHRCAPPEGGAESGEQPDKLPNRPASKVGSERPGREKERERRRGRKERQQQRQQRGGTTEITKEHFWPNRVAMQIVIQPVHLATGALLPDEHVTAVEEKPRVASRPLPARRHRRYAMTSCECT